MIHRNKLFALSGAVAAVVIFASAPAGASVGAALRGNVALDDSNRLTVEGVPVETDVPSVSARGRIFIPLRFAAESLGARALWDNREKRAVLAFEDREVAFKAGEAAAVSGETVIPLDAAPFVYEGRIMAPLSLIEDIGTEITEGGDAPPTPEGLAGDGKPAGEGDGGKTSASGAQNDGGFRSAVSALAGTLNGMETARAQPLDGRSGDAGENAAEGAGPPPAPQAENQPQMSDRDFFILLKEKSRADHITLSLKPYVLTAWVAAMALWVFSALRAALRPADGEPRDLSDKLVTGIILFLVAPLAMTLMFSSYWAAMVAIGAATVGLLSSEEFGDKLVTMGSTAQGLGLICTLFGLGLLVGPAIARHDIIGIGYGIYVKIEPTITGLTLSILLNTLYGYQSRRRKRTG